MKRATMSKRLLASRCSLYIGLLGLTLALTTACGPEGSAEGATPGRSVAPSTTTTDIETEAQMQTPTTGQQSTPTPSLAPVQADLEEGVLGARPGTPRPIGGATQTGQHPLGIAQRRDGLVYVPNGYNAGQPAGLVLLLHGAGGNAEHGISLLQPLADEANLILVAPQSRGSTWDVIMSDYGPDVTYIDQALSQTFGRYVVDPARVAVGGFSDGASYALSLGLINGDLFTHVIAFSPGFMAPTRQVGKPLVYISHGTRDEVLPVDRCSRRIVPQLQRLDYEVSYHEFDGPHTVPADITHEALEWFTR